MKTIMFNQGELTPEEIKQNLESECVDIQEHHEFLRPYSEEEMEEVKARYADTGAELYKLEAKLKAVTEPLKAEIKPVKEVNLSLRKNLSDGGERVSGRVYLFPDYKSNLMGLYDERGILVNTRPLTRAERQLHINSFKQQVNE